MRRVYVLQRRINDRKEKPSDAPCRAVNWWPVEAYETRKEATAAANRRNARASFWLYAVRRTSLRLVGAANA